MAVDILLETARALRERVRRPIITETRRDGERGANREEEVRKLWRK
jgi:hypothetical protein